MSHNPGFLKVVEEARGRVRECTVADVKARLDRAERFHFVDVREDDEYTQEHAAGAIHLGKGVIERDIETVLPNKPVSYTHLRAHETVLDLVCRLLLVKKKKTKTKKHNITYEHN